MIEDFTIIFSNCVIDISAPLDVMLNIERRETKSTFFLGFHKITKTKKPTNHMDDKIKLSFKYFSKKQDDRLF